MSVSTIEPAIFWQENNELYHQTLFDNVLPFWMRYGKDEQFGGISNVIDDQGNALSHNKYLWSQGRALWTFSALYNQIEKRQSWLDFAHHIYQYLQHHGRDERGRWMYLLSENGDILEGDTSIYVDGFVFNGLGEYYKATKNIHALELALETAYNVLERLKTPGNYQIAPYEIPAGMKTHGIAMIFSDFFFQLGKIADDKKLITRGLELAHEILEDFYQPSRDAVLEFVTLDGQFSDTSAGRACVPGHVIEGMWFLIDIFERSNQKNLIPQCCTIIKRHLELAWDEKYDGLLSAIDIDGRKPQYWRNPDCKPWWVQIEALVATAYAYGYTRENWCLEWHRRVQKYAFEHYPVPTGEWTQWLDRQGNPTQSSALPVKDPFHLPRGLIRLINWYQRRF